MRTAFYPINGLLVRCLLLVGIGMDASSSVRAGEFELKDGDRVAMIGATFVERLQYHDYLEALITASYPERNITFRNLGWSGDNVGGESRAVFGKPDDGFARLVKDAVECEPTVFMLVYGMNEAHGGRASQPAFVAGMNRLLDALSSSSRSDATMVLVAGHRRESRLGRLPASTSYNAALYEYNRALAELSRERSVDFVSLEDLVGGETVRQVPLTADGMHLSEYGQWVLAPQMALRFHVPVVVPVATIDTVSLTGSGPARSAREFKKTRNGIQFEWSEQRLPYPQTLKTGGQLHVAPEELRAVTQFRLRVLGLEPGEYHLTIAGQPATRPLSAAQWADVEGVAYENSAGLEQWSELRRTIHEKNLLFFHRYRPQNETYLFLFRKHEQGNNAAEILDFDPLIAEMEERIAALRRPPSQTFELFRDE